LPSRLGHLHLEAGEERARRGEGLLDLDLDLVDAGGVCVVGLGDVDVVTIM
jgi:hypothetical protein